MADIRNQFSARFRAAAGIDRRTILVIGLGRFGSALAEELVAMGHEVLGIDIDERLVNRHSELLTDVRVADCTEIATLEALGAAEIPHAVVGIGADMEASVLTTAALAEVGVEDIWAKALTEPHRRILDRVGANHTLLPEAETGRRVAHMVTGSALSYLTFEDEFVIVETAAPPSISGRPLSESQPRADMGVTVVAIRRPGGPFGPALPDTIPRAGDIVLVAGQRDVVEAFSRRS